MIKTHSLFHKLKSIIGYSVATVVILVALSISGLRFFLTTVDLYQSEVEELASKLLEQPVKIGSMDAKLSGLVPTLIFRDVQLMSKKSKQSVFALSRIDVGISFEELLFSQNIVPTQLTIRGMELHISRTAKGKIKVKGLELERLTTPADEVTTENSVFEKWLLLRSEIAVEDSSIIWQDEKKSGLKWVFKEVNFLLKNSDIHHQLSLSGKLPKILGDKINLELDIEGNITKLPSWNAKIFVESESLNLKPFQQYLNNKKFKLNEGITELKVWADLEKGELKQLSGDVKLYNTEYSFKENKSVNLNFVSAVFDSVKGNNNIWNASVDKFNYINNSGVWPESKFSLAFKLQDKNISNIFINADYLKLGVLTQIINDNNLITNKNKKTLKSLNLHGDIRDFHVVWENNELHKLNAKFNKFSVNAWENIPMLRELAGSFSYENKSGNIFISSKNTAISFPRLFRKEFELEKITADIAFSKTNEGLLFNLKHLLTENTEVQAISAATLFVPKDESSSYLDFQTYASKGDASKVSNYLPVSIMGESLVDWIDQGVLGGRVDNATVIFSGKLDDFPFDKNEGVFSVDLNSSNVTLNYKNGWPRIEKAKIKGTFTGQGMKLHLLNAEVENNFIHNSYADIASFANADLHLNIKANGTLHNASRYIVNSQILPKAKKPVESMRLLGEVATNIRINIPLDNRLRKKKSLSYSGSAFVRDASIFMLDDKLDITNASGEISFNEKKIFSNSLTAKIFGKNSKLKIKTLTKGKGIKVTATGKINPGDMLARFNIPGANNISGETAFNGNIIFPGKAFKKSSPVISLYSKMKGVKSSFPEFLNKRKNSKQSLKFKIVLKPKNKTQFEIDFGGEGSAIFEVNKTTRGSIYLTKGAVSLSTNKAMLPIKNVLYIDGTIKSFTPSMWFKSLALDKSKKPQSFFVNPIIFNLDEFHLHTVSKKKEDRPTIVSNPIALPKFEGIFKKFTLDDVLLGRIDFKTSKIKYGINFDEIILSARNMKLVANGSWLYKKGKHRTDLDMTLSSKNFGTMLTDLGFSPTISEGEAKTVGKLFWDSAPSQFALNTLNGVVQMDLKNGSIIAIDPGAGRLLGFFSLSALPRKLLGDFKESVADGFSFDEAMGEIIINNGDAYTDGFEINGPIADSIVSGRTGLVDRDFENIIEVVPDVGDGVTGMVALLVNLPAGIGLWLMDKLTGEKLNEASTRTYEITGSWKDPKYELIEEEE